MFQIAPKYEIQMDVVSPLALIEFLKTFLVKEWAFNVQLLHLLSAFNVGSWTSVIIDSLTVHRFSFDTN